MLQGTLIGYLGSNAEVKNANGKEFVAFRVANTDKWKLQDGTVREQTTWVDCVMNGNPDVREYLRKGALVFVTGSITLRVYSSPKDKCMKAGMTINVNKLELLGGKPDEIPSRLFRNDNGQMVEVCKYYGVAELINSEPGTQPLELSDDRGNHYIADALGWVKKVIPYDSQE